MKNSLSKFTFEQLVSVLLSLVLFVYSVKMENNEIKITHFVNPHFFFFRWVRDDGKLILIVIESIQIVIKFKFNFPRFFEGIENFGG